LDILSSDLEESFGTGFLLPRRYLHPEKTTWQSLLRLSTPCSKHLDAEPRTWKN